MSIAWFRVLAPIVACTSVSWSQIGAVQGRIDVVAEVRACIAPGECQTISNPVTVEDDDSTFQAESNAAAGDGDHRCSVYAFGEFDIDFPQFPGESTDIIFLGTAILQLGPGASQTGSSASSTITGAFQFGTTRRLEFRATGQSDAVVLLDGAQIPSSGVIAAGWHSLEIRMQHTLQSAQSLDPIVFFRLALSEPEFLFDGLGGSAFGSLSTEQCISPGDCRRQNNVLLLSGFSELDVADGSGQTGGGYGGVSASASANGRVGRSQNNADALNITSRVVAGVSRATGSEGTGRASAGGTVDLRIRALEHLRYILSGDAAVEIDGRPAIHGGTLSEGEHRIAVNLPAVFVSENDPGVDDRRQSQLVMFPHCAADLTGTAMNGVPDGGVTIDDLVFFLEQFAAGDSRADVDDGTWRGVQDGGVTIDDLIFYLDRFRLGC